MNACWSSRSSIILSESEEKAALYTCCRGRGHTCYEVCILHVHALQLRTVEPLNVDFPECKSHMYHVTPEIKTHLLSGHLLSGHLSYQDILWLRCAAIGEATSQVWIVAKLQGLARNFYTHTYTTVLQITKPPEPRFLAPSWSTAAQVPHTQTIRSKERANLEPSETTTANKLIRSVSTLG